MTQWEWYQHPNVFCVFLHLLLTANHEEKKWQGTVVGVGQKITSYPHLARDTGIGVQSVRTAINKLKSTGEITVKTTSKYSLITISNWSKYQIDNTQSNSQLTGNQQATNRQLTTNKNDKKVKNEKNIYGEFGNVLLSDEERKRLIEQLNESAVSTLIDELDQYIESKGVKYKSHYATIQAWARRRINDHAQKIINTKPLSI